MDASIVFTAAGTYAATNLDDFVVLTALFALDRATGARNTARIWAGQFIGIGLLTAAAFLAANALNNVPTSWIRYLSLIPIFIGLKSLRRRNRQPRGERPTTKAGTTLAVVGITVANGGDNMALYIPCSTASIKQREA
ncbi:cadmium resistance transporter [Arthrobacter sp. MMS24-S77]